MKKILILSDLHVGSLWGLWPMKFEAEDTKTGNTLQFVPNLTQKKLWKKWKEMLDDSQDIECVILNGDLIDGNQRKSGGRGTVTPNITWQVDACQQILDTLPDVPKYFTQGTEYHEMSDGTPIEEWLAKQSGDEYGDDLTVEECGIRLHVSHSISSSSSSWQYWTTAIARDLLLLALHAAEEKYGQVDGAVRSHRHNFCAAEFKGQIGIITPCFQTRTPYAVKKDLVSPPDVGWVTLHVAGKNKIMIDRSHIETIQRPCKIVGRDRRK